MVDLKELRIGNYLNIDGLAAPIGPGWFCSADRGHTLPKHEPIPLTPEWLEKLGFKKKPEHGSPAWYILDDYNEYCENGDLYIEGDFIPTNRAKYVHQFQNLYFAIAGKELEIKETA